MLNKFVYSLIYINYSRHGCRQLSCLALGFKAVLKTCSGRTPTQQKIFVTFDLSKVKQRLHNGR